MRVLLISAEGLLGKELFRDFSRGYELLGTYKDEARQELVHLDLVEKEEIKERIESFKPEAVLLSASLTAVDFCEQNQDLAWKVNVEGVKEVAVASKKQGAFLMFYSSDYIFDGERGPYSEDARPNPINFYGKTKWEAEKVIKKELKEFLIIRTCSNYGYEKGSKNFAMQVLTALKDNKIVTAFKDQYGTPTYCEYLSNTTLKLLKNKKEGIFNIVGSDYVNRVQFSMEIAEVFGLDAGLIKEVTSEELRQPAKRPRKAGLKADKLKLETGITPISLREGLVAMKARAIKENGNK